MVLALKLTTYYDPKSRSDPAYAKVKGCQAYCIKLDTILWPDKLSFFFKDFLETFLSHFLVLLLVHLCILCIFVQISLPQRYIAVWDYLTGPDGHLPINARTPTYACKSWCIPELPGPGRV